MALFPGRKDEIAPNGGGLSSRTAAARVSTVRSTHHRQRWETGRPRHLELQQLRRLMPKVLQHITLLQTQSDIALAHKRVGCARAVATHIRSYAPNPSRVYSGPAMWWRRRSIHVAPSVAPHSASQPECR